MVAKELPCDRRLRSPSVANGGVSTCGESVFTVNKDMGKIAQEQYISGELKHPALARLAVRR